MALVDILTATQVQAVQAHQFYALLTGSMTDQPVYIANTIRASTTGASTFTAFAGGTAGGAPASGAHTAGEFIVDTANKIMYICTASGTPGTWATLGVQTDSTAGDYLGLVAAGASSVAGSVGKAADAGHQHPALVNAGSGFTGNLLRLQLNGVDELTVDQNGNAAFSGLVKLPSWNGSAWVLGNAQAVVGMYYTTGARAEARQIFTANSRVDADALEGDILING